MAKREIEWEKWEDVEDIMRPYDASDDAPKAKEAERDWRLKVQEEDRQQHKSEARSRRRIWGLSLRRESEPDKKKKKRGGAIARAYQVRVAAQIAPYAAVLLLAPLISGPGGFYLLVLFLAAPATAAVLLLHPLGRRAWLLRALIPLLPVEAWFTLRFFAWDPGMTLVLVSAFALAGALYYIFAIRAKRPGMDAPKLKAEDARPELEVRVTRQIRRDRSDNEKRAGKERGRRFLLFIVPLTCTALLAPALLGLRLQLLRPAPNEVKSFEAESLENDALMVRRMNGAYEHLQEDKWAQASHQKKLEALQTLLDVETDELGIERFDLRDPVVLAAAAGNGHAGVTALLLSGAAKGELRVRAMCHLAYHLMQLTVFEDADIFRFEAAAQGHEKSRYDKYTAQWNNQETEIDHAG